MTSETKAVPTLGEQIATLKELLAKVEPFDLPWSVGGEGVLHSNTEGYSRHVASYVDEDIAKLIVGAVNTLPALIARVEEVEDDLLRRHRDAVDRNERLTLIDTMASNVLFNVRQHDDTWSMSKAEVLRTFETIRKSSALKGPAA